MLKITLTVQEKKDNTDDCTVKVEMPKNLDKATDSEKSVGGAVYQAVLKTLKELQQKIITQNL